MKGIYMRYRDRMKDIVNLINCKKWVMTLSFVLCLCMAGPVALRVAYGQGTLVETVGTMEIGQEVDNAANRSAPARGPADMRRPVQSESVATEQQEMARLVKMAQKLMQSMQSGSYDKEDFSAVWNNVVPMDDNFSNGINAVLKPVFDQFGRAEKLGDGKITAPDKAVFIVEFTRGNINMILALDPQDKIAEWALTPVAPNPAETATGVEAPAVTADINDFNAFKQELDRIDMEARGEDAQWLGKQEKKAELAKAMDEVVVAELKFLRKVAAAEKDANTVEAIDIVLKKRQDRLNKLVTKLENEVKEERRQQTTERRERRTPRTGGVQQQDQAPTERPARGPVRRARETVNQEQQ